MAPAKRIVVKIDLRLVDQSTGNCARLLKTLPRCCRAMGAGKDVVLVSSGSIALGRGLGLPLSSLPLEQSQAAAAVGQIQLARYEECWPHGITTAQFWSRLRTAQTAADI